MEKYPKSLDFEIVILDSAGEKEYLDGNAFCWNDRETNELIFSIN
jgi:hypothetical protein